MMPTHPESGGHRGGHDKPAAKVDVTDTCKVAVEGGG